MRITDPELINPTIHCFARCFICGKLIAIREGEDGLILGERKCPHCGGFLDDWQVLKSFANNLFHTAAITSANKLVAFDPAVVIYLVVEIVFTFFQFPAWFRFIIVPVYHVPIFVLCRWLYRYWYRVRFADAEYLESLSSVRKSLALWVAANILVWVLLLV